MNPLHFSNLRIAILQYSLLHEFLHSFLNMPKDGGMQRWLQCLNQCARVFTPDDITFVGVLLACTRGVLVDEGKLFFKSMKDFSIAPKLERYGCMVDLLGQSGLLQEAYNLITSMPMEPDSVIWGALLGACSFHVEIKLAEIAVEFLFKLEPWNPENNVIFFELSGVVHKFLVEDKSHPRYQDICLSLREMTVIMKGQLDSDPTVDLEI